MKERPITFSALMVREILDGHKTQTRRVKTPGKCRYGEPGDQLWVRENAWYDPEGRRVDYDADMLTATRAEVKAGGAKLKSSRYMLTGGIKNRFADSGSATGTSTGYDRGGCNRRRYVRQSVDHCTAKFRVLVE